MSNIEAAVRCFVRRCGYRVRKSRREESLDNFGLFMLVENDTNLIVLGSRFDASLDDIADFVLVILVITI